MSDILKRAQDNYKADKDNWSEIYEKARADQHFLSDDQFAQWDSKDYNARITSGRPCLTIDQTGQFTHQVANNIRMNTPRIDVIPAGSDADIKTAEVLKGLIKNIEYISNADQAYDYASLSAIRCSIGFIRVDHRYKSGEEKKQELVIKRIVNPLNCYLDAASIELDGSDAKHATIIESITVEEFKKRFDDAEPSSFGEEKREYKSGEYVNIAEYFEIGEDKKVNHYILSGAAILQETIFPGNYIPLAPVYGEEAWIDGKRQLYSLIRKSKDAQRMFNYWKSLETELLMKQPQAPIMAVAGQVENYAEAWKDPSKAAVLLYDQYDAKGNPAPAPQRLAPPTIPTGIVNAARATVDDIKATMGLYNASLGQQSNETSGVAIERRNQEGDVAVFHFADNLNVSVCHVGKILVCAIPVVHDTAEIARIIGEEDEPKSVGINGELVDNQEQHYNLTKGKYDVRVITGASYTTKRQEAAAFFTDIVSKQPELMQVMGDLLFKNMDFAGAQAMAERMKKVIGAQSPQLLEDGKDGENPQVQQANMALQQAQAQIQELTQQMQKMAEDAQTEIQNLETQIANKGQENAIKGMSEQNKAESDDKKNQIELLKLQLEKEKADNDAAFKMAALEIKRKELEIKEASMMLDAQNKAEIMQHQQSMDVANMQSMDEPNESEESDS